jgi:ligand-binding sensor domain-containing protein
VVRLDLRTLDCTRFSHTIGDLVVPLSDVRNLLLDPDGRLWATVGGAGLARFDGQHWQIALADVNAYGLAFDAAGNLWVEVGVLRGTALFRYPGHEPPEDGLWEGERIWMPPPNGTECDQWFARSEEFHSPEECRLLADWRGQRISLALSEDFVPWGENPLIAKTDDHLWMLARYLPGEPGHYDALLHFDGRTWRVSPWPYGYARLVADEARGGVWAGTNEGLIFSDGRSIQKYLLLPDDVVPVGPGVYELVVDGSGRLWASTDEGLLRYDEASDTWQPGGIDGRVYISADYRGGLWVASAYEGVISHFDGDTWSEYPFPKGWLCSPVADILADVGGGLWLSSYHCKLRGFNGEVWDEYDTGSHGDQLARGPDGTVYAARWSGAIRRYDGTIWETLLPPHPSRRARLTDLAVGLEGEVWVAFDASPNLFVYRGGEWEDVPELGDEAFTALLVGAQGDVWVGYSGGLWHYDEEMWEHIEMEIPFNSVEALAEDRQGHIWVGGTEGLAMWTGDQ